MRGDVKTITVIFMNGQQEEFRVQQWHAKDGILAMFSPNDVSQPDRYIPLANVRTWEVEP